MSIKLTPDSAMKVAKEFTIKAIENNYIPKATNAKNAAALIAEFYTELATELCEDNSINERIHIEQ